MKLHFITVFLLMFAFQTLSAGVIRESKTTVKFKDFGEYTTHETVWLQSLKKHKESENDFKAQGMMGKMMSKFVFGDRKKGEIIDLEGMKVYDIFHDKKQYRVRPIEKLTFEESEEHYSPDTEAEYEEDEYKEEESSIKITRQVFKVVPTGKSKTINNFPCKEYQIFWVMEWENTETGEKGKDSLFTDVWATASNQNIEDAIKEEQEFQKTFMEKVGFPVGMETDAILGLNWFKLFRAMNQESNNMSDFKGSGFVQELNKIEGLPILIEGQYFATRPKPKQEMQEEKPGLDITNPGGMFGGFLKKKLKEKTMKKTAAKGPDFSYRTELIKLEKAPLGDQSFQVPAGYSLIE
ncbi:hypothetical protein ACX8XN_06270 [Calditrichota bacterium GD2]